MHKESEDEALAMSRTDLDEILDDLFHGAAFAAYVEEMCLAKGPPCPQKTKQRAYRYYEEALAEKNAMR